MTSERSLWQGEEWEEFQKSLGFKTHRIDGELLIIVPVLRYFHYGYIPRGRTFPEGLKDFGEKHSLIFIRLDPVIEIPGRKDLKTIRSFSAQVEKTLVLDLTRSEDELLKKMKRKGRYNIQLARKKGVMVKKAGSSGEQKEFLKMFYELLKATTERDKFSGHDEEYYATMLEKITGSEIFLAFFGSLPLAGAIVVFEKDQAIYYYGASGQEHKDLMAPYLLQWECIREAKQRGCKEYDFLGIAPNNDEHHPYAGITSFKKKFGGVERDYPKPRDLVIRPLTYQMYRFLKWIQKKARILSA